MNPNSLQFDNAVAGRIERLERRILALESAPREKDMVLESQEARIRQLEGELRAMKARMGRKEFNTA